LVEPKTAGTFFQKPILGRGVAVGDLNNDGRPDAVVAALDAPPVLLWNRAESLPARVLDLVPRRGGSVVGARIRGSVEGRAFVAEVVGGGSYLSASDRRLFVPHNAEHLEVTWPSGGITKLTKRSPGTVERLREEERR
jgi:hypothetical protein